MDALTLIVGLALVALTLLIILYPLWQQTRLRSMFQADTTPQILADYEARYQAALSNIKELMFDYEMGKISTEDYQPLLAKAKLEAAAIRQQFDRLSQTAATAIDPQLDAQIETLVAEFKQQPKASSKALHRAVEAEIEALKGAAPARSNERSCPNCGKPVDIEDAFCSKCGQALPQLSQPAGPDETLCPQCSYAYQPGDTFCAHCGAALAGAINQSNPQEVKV